MSRHKNHEFEASWDRTVKICLKKENNDQAKNRELREAEIRGKQARVHEQEASSYDSSPK